MMSMVGWQARFRLYCRGRVVVRARCAYRLGRLQPSAFEWKRLKTDMPVNMWYMEGGRAVKERLRGVCKYAAYPLLYIRQSRGPISAMLHPFPTAVFGHAGSRTLIYSIATDAPMPPVVLCTNMEFRILPSTYTSMQHD
jgi:hypothetical protein